MTDAGSTVGFQVTTNFTDKYQVLGVIGRGSFSVVKKCLHKDTGTTYATKVVITWNMKHLELSRLAREIRICQKLSHPHIVQLFESIQEKFEHYLVFEYINGGELFDDIVKKVHYSEYDASVYTEQILLALQYCHSKNVIHRDVKPENLLLAKISENEQIIKLTDFGLAVEVNENRLGWYGFAGTSAYLSPEMLRRDQYGKMVDVWACGVVLYILLIGFPPFWHYEQQTLYERIKAGDYYIECDQWNTLTPGAQDLVDSMLTVNQRKRISATEALEHPWISNRIEEADSEHRGSVRNVLKNFNARRKFKGVVWAVSAAMTLSKGRQKEKTEPTVDPHQVRISHTETTSGTVSEPSEQRTKRRALRRSLCSLS